jgi:probable rRNA maturation factor
VIFIEVNPNLQINLESSLFEKACQVTLLETNIEQDPELTVVITDNIQIRKLNKKFRKIDTETDVLSFPADEINPETGNGYLGDVIISYTQAFKQASQSNHPVEKELQLLTVHGVLHLIGFDHTNKEEKNRMWDVQDEVLKKLGITDIIITDGEGEY